MTVRLSKHAKHISEFISHVCYYQGGGGVASYIWHCLTEGKRLEACEDIL